MDKTPEKHLGSKLAAMERQGYASREGVHNGKIDADRHLVQVLERSRQSRYRVRQHLAPVRATLDLAAGGPNEKVVEEATELRHLVGSLPDHRAFSDRPHAAQGPASGTQEVGARETVPDGEVGGARTGENRRGNPNTGVRC